MYLRDKFVEFIGEPPLRGLKEVPAPFSLASLIAWLETKNPAEEYNYTRPHACMIGQWAGQSLAPWSVDKITFAGADQIACDHPWTFGGALKRALLLQANAVSGSSPILISEGV